MEIIVCFRGRVAGMDGADLDRAVLDIHLDAVMDRLVELEDDTMTDSDMSADLASGEVELSIMVTAERVEEAVDRGLGAIRTAIHAAGGYTHNWAEPERPEWTMDYLGSDQRPADLEPA